MHHKRAAAHGKRMHIGDGEIPHARAARHDAQPHHDGGLAIRLPHRLAHAQFTRHEPAAVGRQPGVIRRGVDRLVVRVSCWFGGGLGGALRMLRRGRRSNGGR